MTVDVKIPESLTRFMQVLKPSGRHLLFSAAGNAVSVLINNYLKRVAAPTHHKTAERLGATPTGHLEKRTSFSSDSSSATVTIPIPGISRAFKSLTITPKKAPFLTLPIASQSYGSTTKEMRSIGWMLFRPPAKGAHKMESGKFDRYQDILMGSKDGEAIPLYLLRNRVNQKQDRTLLPSDASITQAAAQAMAAIIRAKGAA